MKTKQNKFGLKELSSIIQDFIDFKSKDEINELKDELLHLKFMHAIEKIIIDKGIKTKELAEKLNISQDCMIKLFTAEKFIDIKTLGKIQRLLDVSFDVIYKDVKKIKIKTKHK